MELHKVSCRFGRARASVILSCEPSSCTYSCDRNAKFSSSCPEVAEFLSLSLVLLVDAREALFDALLRGSDQINRSTWRSLFLLSFGLGEGEDHHFHRVLSIGVVDGVCGCGHTVFHSKRSPESGPPLQRKTPDISISFLRVEERGSVLCELLPSTFSSPELFSSICRGTQVHSASGETF